MRDKIIAILESYCASVAEEVGEIRSGIEGLRAGITPTRMKTVLRQAHTVKGSGGTLGFNELQDAAAALEAKLKELEWGGSTPDLDHEIERLEGDLSMVVARMEPTQSTLYARFGGGL